MKKQALIIAISSTLFFTACTETVPAKKADVAAKPAPKQAVYDCVFPTTNTPAPGWVCDEPVPGVAVSALGIAEPSQAGISYMKDIASTDARGRLAEQMQVVVQKMVKKYLGTTGVGNAQSIDAASSSTIRSITSQSLEGSKIYKSRTGPNGRLYVLVGLNESSKDKVAEEAVKTSMKNDRAAWQQFKAKQSFDEMAAGIANQ